MQRNIRKNVVDKGEAVQTIFSIELWSEGQNSCTKKYALFGNNNNCILHSRPCATGCNV
jgi:hypothetical protein